LRVDGAASRNNLLMQIQADVAGVRVVRASISEITALGAAYLAGLEPHWKADRVFEPQTDCSALRDQWRARVTRAST
jgi:glycerol kinase